MITRKRRRPRGGRAGIALLAPIVLASMATTACNRAPKRAAPPPPNVTFCHPVHQAVTEWDEYTGYLEAVEFVDVRARVGGLIMQAPFTEGALVKQGDLLFEIDKRPYQADLESKIALAARAEAQVDLANIQYQHLKDLMPQNSASRIEFDDAEASLRAARADLEGARAAVDAARLNVEWCRVLAPIAGRISRKLVTPGNLVTPGAQGTLLTTIASIDPIYCYVDADERSVLKYQKLAREGKRLSARDTTIPCYLALADENNFPHAGVIDFVDNRIDPQTGTMRARGVFPNLHGWLIPGSFGRIRVPGSGRYMTWLVPDEAVYTDQDKQMLLVVGPDNVVQPKPVELGAVFGTFRSIVSGITEEDRVITNGLMLARPGARVNPRFKALDTGILRTPSTTPTSEPVDAAVHTPTATRPASAPSNDSTPTERTAP